ncbi:hypothetical protein IC762_15790 [Bradyrhizobium genosp. L]|uniref:hypothetical protein n=1 Tax=Bradyrhizobium genosp. L TaxID=83637 RepID=UPI0018A2C566|nr:hypothetical protein [Bradyrhizobium genosp. L]QPF87659.1 hypothetical protein IC762_15790 [Bradyrhizobium genosp. L]
MVAVLLWLGAPAAAAPINCGSEPSVKCLADAVFALAKTLPADNFYRKHVAFAERELAPGDIRVALDYVNWDNPDPAPWEDIDWIARAGRFDVAIERAKQRTEPIQRLGGLLAVATWMLEKNETARAKQIVEDVDRELPSLASSNDDFAAILPLDTGELSARLGQTDRAASLIGGSNPVSLERLLTVASKYPAAASLRERAWREAERVNDLDLWIPLLQDAVSRGDRAEIFRATQRVGKAIDHAANLNEPTQAISLALLFLKAGSLDFAARLIKPWPTWVDGKEAIAQVNLVSDLAPVLVGLALDQDVRTAIEFVNNPARRAEVLGKAAQEYARLGRRDLFRKLDAEAETLAASSPTSDAKLRSDHDSALNNLGLLRARHGDIDGAVSAAAKLPDDGITHEVMFYVVRNAIDGGYSSLVGPALDIVEQRASAARDAHALLAAANTRYEINNEDKARDDLAQALSIASLTGSDAGLAAALTWWLDGDGTAETLVAIVDKMRLTDSDAINQLIETVRPVSPAVALRLVDRQTDIERRIDELTNIAIAIAEKSN